MILQNNFILKEPKAI